MVAWSSKLQKMRKDCLEKYIWSEIFLKILELFNSSNDLNMNSQTLALLDALSAGVDILMRFSMI
jgi:hypothetical protein